MGTIIILIALALVLTGCGGGGGDEVVAGFYPLAFAASEIGGAPVRDMTPPGTEPHDLELSPRDVAAVEGAGLVLLLGDGFQPQLERAAERSERTVALLDDPGVKAFANNDPHVWLDPVRFAAVARRIGKELHKPAAPLVGRLHALDRELRAGLSDCERHEIVTSHDAFGYLAKRYGLKEAAISGVSPDAEPTPAALQRVVDTVRRTRATTVFSEPLVSRRLAETVSKETGARTDVLDPIESRPARGDYFGAMRENLAKLRKALACR